MKFFYDSLETLQKVTFASKKDYIMLSIGVVVSVVLFGAFFISIDTLFSGGYKTFYSIMRGDATPTFEQMIDVDADEVVTVLPGAEDDGIVEPIVETTEDSDIVLE